MSTAALGRVNGALLPSAAFAELDAAAFEFEQEHDHRYRVARQQYLRQLLSDPRQPRHVRGWVQQELNRLERIERAQQQGLTRYARGGVGQFLPGGSARYLRGIPGMDVGHKLGKHDQHDPRNFRLEDARFNRARPGISRRLGLFHKYREAEALEAALENAAERMDVGDLVGPIRDLLKALPPDVKQDIQRRAKQMWDVRGLYFTRLLAALNTVLAQNPAGWQEAIARNRAAAAHQLAVLAGRQARLPARSATSPPGMSPVQVRQYRRRQQARGYVPGRGRGRQRELELEIDRASQELEGAETFWTKVTPIPGIGNKEGHEILTRRAMAGLGLRPPDPYHIETGVIRPDRGGRSYWRFPRAALEGLKAAAQSSHSLRPTPSSSVAAALRLIQARFAGLHRRAMLAPTRQQALEWLGEALHLLQDSYSSAHTERAGGVGRIRNIRAFFIRLGWPPMSRAPHEHNAPSDPRDNIFAGGALRPEARAAIAASRAFLVMALRHLRSPHSPANRAHLLAFIRRYLS